MGDVMEFVQILTNTTIWIPALAWVIAQIVKTAINAGINKKMSFSRLVGDGGMPSGHSATVTALAVMCGFEAGFDSVVFALAVMFAIVVMKDALGVRRETGKQAESIISIAHLLNEAMVEKDEEIKTEKLKVLVGHTPLQVVCGAALGLVVVIVYQLIIM